MVTGPSKPSYSIGAFTFANSPSELEPLAEGELAKVQGSLSTLIQWANQKAQSGCLSINTETIKFPSVASENCFGATIGISFGGNQPHNTIQPTYGVYKFRRIN